MKKIIYFSLLFFILKFYSQTDSGNLENYLNTKIAALPLEDANNFKIPLETEITSWANAINALLSDDLVSARAEAALLNYRIVEYTDTAIGNNDVFYVMEEEAIQTKYWGTYVFAQNAARPNLILQAPHSEFDTNTGKQAIYSFVRLNNKALFLNGTHRCNHTSFSDCAGTTKVCNGNESKKYRISDMAHNEETVFQKTTEILYNTYSTSVFFQLHGFEKKDSDPYVILGNGTSKTPNIDYAVQLKTALLEQDNTLTFRLGHLDDWNRLLGTTNTQGRLINNSNNPCSLSAQNPSGRFLHIEQEKSKLRQDNIGWNKMYEALRSIFTIPSSIWLGNTTDWDTASNWSSNTIPISTDNLVIKDIANQPTISSNTNAIANNITIDDNASITIENGGSLILEGFATVYGSFIYNLNVNDSKWHLITSPVKHEEFGDNWNTTNQIDTNLPNEAIAKYINTNGISTNWSYYQNGENAEQFSDGVGYSLKRTLAGNYNFSGVFPSSPVVTQITTGNFGNQNLENRWNLVGNPFPSYLDVDTFLTENIEALKDTHESLYVWNANAGINGEYQSVSTGHIHPGQAFFVNSDKDTTSVAFTKAMQSTANGVSFYKTQSTKILISVFNGSINKSTEINFLEGKTLGLDPRFDIGTFTGNSSSFNIYTHLVSNNEGVSFMKQALPKSILGKVIIPIGLNAKANQVIQFSSKNTNLPNDIEILLEDKLKNSIINITAKEANYSLKLTNDINGVGRFYLHTSKKTLSNYNSSINNINIYLKNNKTLRVDGLSSEKTTITIYNILGKEVINTTFSTLSSSKDIPLSNLGHGFYLLKLKNTYGNVEKKIVLIDK